MRVSKDLSPGLKMLNIRTGEEMGDFNSSMFIKGVLDRYVGKSEGEVLQWVSLEPNGATVQRPFAPPRFISAAEGMWKPEAATNRLFVFSTAAVADIAPADISTVAYAFGKLEASVSDVSVGDDELARFSGKCAYTRFAFEGGEGMWHTFHRDGGASLLFGAESDFPDVPFNIHKRMLPGTEKHSRFGRPLSAFSLCELMNFKRTFMRNIHRELQLLVNKPSNEHDIKMAHNLHEAYARLLWYRVHCGEASSVSASSVSRK
jgi:hypothetical protein